MIMIIVIIFFVFPFLSFLPFLVSFLPHLSSETEQAKGKRKPVFLWNSHLSMKHAFCPSSQQSMPYISPQPAPYLGVGRGGFPRTGVRPRQGDSPEDTDPKLHTPLSDSGISDPTPLSPPKQRVAVRVWYECVRVRAHPSVRLCVYVWRDGKCQVFIFLFHHTVLLITRFWLLPNKKGKTKPRRFLVYHLAESSMFHKQPLSQACHDHIF